MKTKINILTVLCSLVLFFSPETVFTQSGGSAEQIEYTVIVHYIPYTRTDSGRDSQRSGTSDRSGYRDESSDSSRERSNSKESERSFQQQSGKEMETEINVLASSVAEAERIAQDRFLALYRDSGSVQYQFVSAKVKMLTFEVVIRYTLDNKDPLILTKKITIQAPSAQVAEREAQKQWEKTKVPDWVFKGISSKQQK